MPAASGATGASSTDATMRKPPFGSGATTTMPSLEKSSETSSRPSGQRIRTSARTKDSASASPSKAMPAASRTVLCMPSPATT